MVGISAPPAAALLSYPSYIGDKDVEGAGWVYTVSSKSLLEDVFTSVKLKRALELDPDPDSPAARHPYVVGRVAVVEGPDIDAATEAAAKAVRGWAAVPLADRMRLGRLFREQLLLRRDELLDILVAEAHPRKLARWELTCLLNVFSDESISWYEQHMHTEFEHAGRRLIVRRQPDGVVCLNPPQNAPAPSSALAVLALMAGNAVVVRAPRSIALSTMYILRELVVPLLAELGAPAGTLNVICGKPRQILDRWLEHPLVDDILYFGGSEEGLRFERECVARGKKPILELAGNDGLVVWKDADLDQAAEAITECFFGSGQICMVPNYVVVHPEVAESLLHACAPGLADPARAPRRRRGAALPGARRREVLRAAGRGDRGRGGAGDRRPAGRASTATPSETGLFLEPTVMRVDGLTKPASSTWSATRRSSRCCR